MRVYCFVCVPFLLSMIWSFAESATPMQRTLWAVVVLLTVLYVGVLPVCYRRLFAWQGQLMRRVLLVGHWITIVFVLLALPGAIGIISIPLGDTAEVILWSVVAAQMANVLAGANYEREQVAVRADRLVAS